MTKGTIYVRMDPNNPLLVVDSTKSRYEHDKESLRKELQQKEAKLLFDIEMWLNGEIAQQAFKMFHIGLRVHLPADE